jgi:hypothetical protein
VTRTEGSHSVFDNNGSEIVSDGSNTLRFSARLTRAYSFQSRSFREAKEVMTRFHSSMYRKPYLIKAIAQFLVAHPHSSADDVGCMVQEITSVKFRYALPLQTLNHSLSLQVGSLTVKIVLDNFQVCAHSFQGSVGLLQ